MRKGHRYVAFQKREKLVITNFGAARPTRRRNGRRVSLQGGSHMSFGMPEEQDPKQFAKSVQAAQRRSLEKERL